MMVDTEQVLAQMRAANPAPSLEQLAVDDLDLVRNIVARERSATTTPMTEQPQTRPDLLIPQKGLRPVLVTGLAFILVLGTLGAALLLFRGSNPELAGSGSMIAAESTCPPDSSDFINATFDPGTGRALMLADEGAFCIFDVHSNTWTAAPQLGGIGLVTDLVYDVDSDRAIAFGKNSAVGVQVWAYGPDGQGWTRKTNLSNVMRRPAAVQAVYDPVTGLVVARATTSQMWTYDVDTDTWTEVDQGATLPPATYRLNIQLLTYDASMDRLILYDNAFEPNTWEFDIRAGRWEKQATNTPDLGWGWGPGADEFVYDEANQVSVIYGGASSEPYIATYDASEHSWTELWWSGPPQIPSTDATPAPWGSAGPIPGVDPSRDVHFVRAMTYDPVNQQILVPSWPSGVFAFDVATGEWIVLLEPTTEPIDEPTRSAGSACPPGATPNRPGPPDQPHPFGGWTGIATFDPGSDRMLVLTLGQEFWMFDVCTNTWTEAPWPEGFGAPLDLVYDIDSDRAIAFVENEEEGTAQAWAYNTDEQTWTRKADWPVGLPREWALHDAQQFQAVYDPVTGLAVVREIHSSQMWNYDVDADTWTEIDQGGTLPPPAIYFQFLTYDASVDRLILYVAPDRGADSALGTWEFDIRAGRWEEQQTNTPQVSFGWNPNGGEFFYDEANQVSVIFSDAADKRFSDGATAAYDASEHSWTVLQYENEVGEPAPYGYDPVNQRILVTDIGGAVFAFDVASGEWITLLDPL